ncbi:MAG: hypothetical protein AB2A00_08040 [Myxococcota bacterium]
MAPALLGTLVMCALALMACIPEYYAVEQDNTNHPVVIDKTAVVPQVPWETDGHVVWDPAQQSTYEFQLRSIEDADASDTLYATWFVAFDQNVSGLNSYSDFHEIPPPAEGPRRDIYVLTASKLAEIDRFRNAAVDGGAVARRRYLVTVKVADRQPQISRTLDTYPSDATTDQVHWTLEVASTGSP